MVHRLAGSSPVLSQHKTLKLKCLTIGLPATVSNLWPCLWSAPWTSKSPSLAILLSWHGASRLVKSSNREIVCLQHLAPWCVIRLTSLGMKWEVECIQLAQNYTSTFEQVQVRVPNNKLGAADSQVSVYQTMTGRSGVWRTSGKLLLERLVLLYVLLVVLWLLSALLLMFSVDLVKCPPQF